MRLRSGSNRIINRKNLAAKLSKELDLPVEEIVKAIKAQTLLIQDGMGTKENEWNNVYTPIRLQYVGVFKPTRRRASYVEKRMLTIATKEIQARLKAQKELDNFLERQRK